MPTLFKNVRSNSPGARLIETPRKRVAGPRGGDDDGWHDDRTGARPWRADVAAAQARGGAASAPRKIRSWSRALGVTAATLSGWRDAFLTAGEAALASKPVDGKDLEQQRLKAKLGEVMLEREILVEKITLPEADRALWPGGGQGHELPSLLRHGRGAADTVEELRQAVLACKERCNRSWIVERHGCKTPAQVRAEQLPPAALAAWAPTWCLTTALRSTGR
jgi:transposase